MNVESSYGIEIRPCGFEDMFRKTMRIFDEAVSFACDKIDSAWDEVSSVPNARRRKTFVESLFHKTKDNPNPRFGEFDVMFFKMPSYCRRAVLAVAYGLVSSYRSNLANWEAGGHAGKRPVLGKVVHAAPVFYHGNMFEKTERPDVVRLKLYDGKNWVWKDVRISASDMRWLEKRWSGVGEKSPSLRKKNRKWILTFTFEESVELADVSDPKKIKICSVDLGINSDAVCSTMKSDGTVLARKFINFGSDKDRLYKVLGRISRRTRKYGPKSTKGLWRYAVALNARLADEIAKSIVSFAHENGCSVIVFEHLDMKGKIKGGKKQRIAMWRKNDVQKRTERKAHALGMRISRVLAWGTSALAYDGSGKVVRDENNHALCTFQTGKRYNCDLSASYNVGARYFIREILKPLSETRESEVRAKVPELRRRTSCVLDTLLKLNAELSA